GVWAPADAATGGITTTSGVRAAAHRGGLASPRRGRHFSPSMRRLASNKNILVFAARGKPFSAGRRSGENTTGGGRNTVDLLEFFGSCWHCGSPLIVRHCR